MIFARTDRTHSRGSRGDSEWEVVFDDEFRRDDFSAMDAEQRRALIAAADALEKSGPAAGRPLVGTLDNPKHPNMKELRYDEEGAREGRMLWTGGRWERSRYREGANEIDSGAHMTTKLSQLMAELSPEDRKEVERRSRAHLKAMADARRLDEIRHAVNMTQGDIARAMGIGQNAVSQLEKRKDLQLSTLNRYVESVGFHLELSVVSDSGERVTLEHFRPWEHVTRPSKKRSAPKQNVSAKSPRRAGSASSREGAAAKGTGRTKKPGG